MKEHLRQLVTPCLDSHNIKSKTSNNFKQMLKKIVIINGSPTSKIILQLILAAGYIIMTYSGNHCRLVTYNKKEIF